MSKGFLITVEELARHPWKLEAKMRNLANIELWKNHYRGKRISNGIKLKPWREKIERLEREINQQKKESVRKRKELIRERERGEREREAFAKFHEKILQFHHSLIDKCERFKSRNLKPNTTEYENFMAIAGRSVGTDLFDLPEVKTGMMSLECFKEKERNNNFISTAEHFWPRSTVGGRDLIELCLSLGDKYNIRITITTLYELCQTVETTADENNRLCAFQKADTFIDPQTSYDSAEITVVQYKDFILPKSWSTLFSEYDIAIESRSPYQFRDVMTREEANQVINKDTKREPWPWSTSKSKEFQGQLDAKAGRPMKTQGELKGKDAADTFSDYVRGYKSVLKNEEVAQTTPKGS